LVVDAVDDQPADVHDRFSAYLERVGLVSVDDASELLLVLDGESDRSMGESAMLELIDHLGNSSAPDAFTAWFGSNSRVLRRRARTARRVDDWLTLMRARGGDSLDAADIEQASDWLQLRLASELAPSRGLATLAERGRTRRIRALAADRLPTT
jgi:hypothetical protein